MGTLVVILSTSVSQAIDVRRYDPLLIIIHTSDHITAVKPLAQSLHRSMRNSSNQFEPLQRDLAVLMSDLDIVIEEGPKYNINCDNEPALCNISQNLQEILNDLQKLKLHYDSVGAQTQMTWDREQWRADELSEIKARLDTATSSLNTVYNKLIL